VKYDKYQITKNKIFQESGVTQDVDLQDVALFKDFTKKELRRLFYISELIEVKENDYLFKAGEKDDNVYVVLQGSINVVNEKTDGTEDMLVSTIHSGEHLNETAIFIDAPHRYSVQAVSNSILMKIPKENALNIMESNPDVASKVLWEVSRKLSERLLATTKKYTDTSDRISDVSDSMDT
jgi:CRP-like cAMP-binding protein